MNRSTNNLDEYKPPSDENGGGSAPEATNFPELNLSAYAAGKVEPRNFAEVVNEAARAGISALILCAGCSSRMGAPKALLRWGEETVLEHVIGLFTEVGVRDVKVVLGHEAERILPVVEGCGADSVHNDRFEEGMFSSVQAGIRHLGPACRAFFLLPVDMPLVQPETLQTLLMAFPEQGLEVFRPCFRGRRGHPPLISSNLIPAILGFDGQGGLRNLLARYPERSMDIEVEDPGILQNMNSREEYREALKETGFP